MNFYQSTRDQASGAWRSEQGIWATVGAAKPDLAVVNFAFFNESKRFAIEEMYCFPNILPMHMLEHVVLSISIALNSTAKSLSNS